MAGSSELETHLQALSDLMTNGPSILLNYRSEVRYLVRVV